MCFADLFVVSCRPHPSPLSPLVARNGKDISFYRKEFSKQEVRVRVGVRVRVRVRVRVSVRVRVRVRVRPVFHATNVVCSLSNLTLTLTLTPRLRSKEWKRPDDVPTISKRRL